VSLTTHTRVNNSYVDGFLGEIAIGVTKDESGLVNILGLDGVSNVDDVDFRIGAQDDALRNGNISIIGTKVGGQGYY